MSHSFDVLVAGGGPAGSATALSLRRRGLTVALIEQDNYASPRVGETLPPFIRQHLTELGVWQQFLESAPLQSFGIQTAWESPESRHQNFIQNPYGCGWHVDRARFDSILATAAADAGAALILSARVSGCALENDRWHLEAVHEGKLMTFDGRMLVDATGRKALLASRLGAQAEVADRLIGAVCFCERTEEAQWALIEAVEEGWWYSAPLPGSRMVFAYMTDSDLWKAQLWYELLQSAPLTFDRAGHRELLPPSLVVSAATVVRRPVTGTNWIATGDAALAFDPLSGQGVLKSIETGTRCAAAVAGAFAGDTESMAEYERWVHGTYEGYLSDYRRFYGSVQRWPASQFWKRRQAGE